MMNVVFSPAGFQLERSASVRVLSVISCIL